MKSLTAKVKQTSIDKFNSLKKTAARKVLSTILKQAKKEGVPEVVEFIEEMLASQEGKERLTLSGKPTIMQNVIESQLCGIEPYSADLGIDDESMDLGRVSQEDIYKMINDKILEAIDKYGDLPWRQPWDLAKANEKGNTQPLDSRLAYNWVSGKNYRGINAILLNFVYPIIRGQKVNTNAFLTAKQVDKLGGRMKKGSRAAQVTYFQYLYFNGNDRINELEYRELKEKEAREKKVNFSLKKIPFLRYYNVFFADDIEGIDFSSITPTKSQTTKSSVEPVHVAEEIISHMPNAPVFMTGVKASYSPKYDRIQMPPIETFEIVGEYYSTYFHELTHSTKHESRLNDSTRGGKPFGDTEYAKEELVAELGAAYLCAESGILFHTIYSTAAYLKGWKQGLEDDPKYFFTAASKAQASTDYILAPNKDGVPKYLVELMKDPDRNKGETNGSKSKPKKAPKPKQVRTFDDEQQILNRIHQLTTKERKTVDDLRKAQAFVAQQVAEGEVSPVSPNRELVNQLSIRLSKAVEKVPQGMDGSTQLTLKFDDSELVESLAKSVQIYPSVKLVKALSRLHLTTPSRDKVNRLIDRIEKAYATESVQQYDPFYQDVQSALKKLKRWTPGEQIDILVNPQLNGPATDLGCLFEYCGCNVEENRLGK